MPPDEIRVFDRYPSRVAAEIVAGRLRDAGLRPQVRADDVGGGYPSVNPMQGVRLLLLESEHEAAREVLASTPDVSDIDPGAPVEILNPRLPTWIIGLACFIAGLLVAWFLMGGPE